MVKRYTTGVLVPTPSLVNRYHILDYGEPTKAIGTKYAILHIFDECEITGGDFIGGNFYGGEYSGGLFFGEGEFFGGDYTGGRFTGTGMFFGGTYDEGGGWFPDNWVPDRIHSHYESETGDMIND